MAIEVSRDNFEEEVLQSKELVIVDFWGPKCRPCLVLMPIVEQLEKDYAGRLKVAKVNTLENRMLCTKLRVLGLPSFLLYKGGTEVSRLTGEGVSKSDLEEAISAALD